MANITIPSIPDHTGTNREFTSQVKKITSVRRLAELELNWAVSNLVKQTRPEKHEYTANNSLFCTSYTHYMLKLIAVGIIIQTHKSAVFVVCVFVRWWLNLISMLFLIAGTPVWSSIASVSASFSMVFSDNSFLWNHLVYRKKNETHKISHSAPIYRNLELAHVT